MVDHIQADLSMRMCECVCERVCLCVTQNVCLHSNTPGECFKGQPGLGVQLATPGNQSALEFLGVPSRPLITDSGPADSH